MINESYRTKIVQKDTGYDRICGICAKRFGNKVFGSRDLIFEECDTCRGKEPPKDRARRNETTIADRRFLRSNPDTTFLPR